MRPSAKSRAKARRVSEARKDIRLSLHAARGPYCQACPVLRPAEEPAPWTDMHEVLSRGRGGDPTDPENILCLCRPCHHWVTVNPADATEAGLLRAMSVDEFAVRYRIEQAVQAPPVTQPKGGIVSI